MYLYTIIISASTYKYTRKKKRIISLDYFLCFWHPLNVTACSFYSTLCTFFSSSFPFRVSPFETNTGTSVCGGSFPVISEYEASNFVLNEWKLNLWLFALMYSNDERYTTLCFSFSVSEMPKNEDIRFNWVEKSVIKSW